MVEGTALVTKYLQAYADGSLETMYSCMDPAFTFSDPPFPNLDTRLSKGMFDMFISRRATNKMKVTFADIENPTGLEFKTVYTVVYLYNDRPVTNTISTTITLSPESGLILTQVDSFALWPWARQALGFPGLLLGWSTYLERQVQEKAGATLESFVSKQEGKSANTATPNL